MRHWYTRYQISNAVDQGTLAARLAHGHAARCPSCQAFARDLQALHARLTDGAAAAPVPVRAVARRPRWVLLAAPLALGATAAVAIALGARGAAPPIHDPIGPIVEAPRPAGVVRVRDVTDRVSALLASTTPLDAELDDLLHDGRRGLDTVLATGGLRRTD
jgi:hypothetical protein